MNRLALATAALITSTAAACTITTHEAPVDRATDPGREGDACSFDSDCRADLECIHRVCAVEPAPEPEPEPECTRDEDCSAGELCSDDQTCEADAHCQLIETEAECLLDTACTSLYSGTDCSCDDTGACSCESYSFAGCAQGTLAPP